MTTISPELEKQISDEAEAVTAKISAKDSYHNGLINGYEDGYEIAGNKYGYLWEQAEAQTEKLRLALVMAVFALKLSYDVIEHPANGETEQDSAIKIGEQALADYNTYKKSKDDK